MPVIKGDIARAIDVLNEHYPMVSGRWYGSRYTIGYGWQTSYTLTGLRCVLNPIYIPREISIDRLGLVVRTGGGAGSTLQIGLYGSDSESKEPTNRIVSSGDLDANVGTDTYTRLTVVVDETLEPGWYYLAVVGSTNLVIRGYPPSSIIFGDNNAASNEFLTGFYEVLGSANLPETYGGSSHEWQNIYGVDLRIV